MLKIKKYNTIFIPNSTVLVSLTGAELIKQADLLVFNSEDILESYLSLGSSKSKKIILLPNVFLFDIIKIIFIVIASKKITTTHECCWYQLDFVLMILRVRHEHFESLTLHGLTKKPYESMSNKNIFFTSLIISKIKVYIINYFFDTYWEFTDENSLSFPVIKIKSKFIPYRKKLPRDLYIYKKNVKKSNKVLLLLAKEPIDLKRQSEHYSGIISFLLQSGFVIYLKDHVRLDLRFLTDQNIKDLKYNLTLLSSKTPSEIFLTQLDISWVISISSTGVCANSAKGISTINMLDFSNEYKKTKTQTLNYLANERNTTVFFPKTLSELKQFLSY